ncbi:hypothetical protein ACMD2_16680 [Ananas comosus]|uniref:Uncharacterized protein n=1 Tax=Ananas comosus TaxID=4615 RepID=A0A199VF52_ANACO|nr:hypothetical protein ACMD2_16680 [Ananas comosus]
MAGLTRLSSASTGHLSRRIGTLIFPAQRSGRFLDHVQIILRCYFQPSLLCPLPLYLDLISLAWTSSPSIEDPASRFSSKMQGVQKALRAWSSGLTSFIKTQTSLCLHWLNWLDIAEDGRALSILECKLRPLLKGRYEELCLQEEIKWRQRSKVQWIRAGDANTKFFHMRANGRRNKNFISRIMDGDAVLSTPGSISDHLSSFFRSHLGVEQTDLDLIIDLHFLYRDDNFDLSNLFSAFSMEESKAGTAVPPFPWNKLVPR